ncbi:MAG TPA: thymidine phosphorylase [Sphingobacteriaceae bacterium]|nr:thymidine phosphorylase [Sphingobacteriaceae bacterium]
MAGMVDWILAKRSGQELPADVIRQMIAEYTRGDIPDYQMAAMLMAMWFRGLTEAETVALTEAMARSGSVIRPEDLPPGAADKHSTGGVGDKTTLVVVPLVAAAGVPVAKLSGRGLGHTGGTLDKLAAIPGFRTDLPLPRLLAQVHHIGAAMAGQTAELVPADQKLYALRDVTGTVDSMPLVAASIMSKKLALGAMNIVLDVKVGRGAFMPDLAAARALAETMVAIGTRLGRRVTALLTDMDHPLGRAVGNALEVKEAIAALAGHGPADLVDLALGLGSEMVAASRGISPQEARGHLTQLLRSGAALAKLEAIIAAQGGDPRVVENPDLLPQAPVVEPVTAPDSGWVAGIDALAVGRIAMDLGAGRKHKEDVIDLRTGVQLAVHVGQEAVAGRPLAWVHAANPDAAAKASARLRQAFTIAGEQPPPRSIILDRVAADDPTP